MNAEYLRLSYERTLAIECRRHLMEKYLEGGGGSRDVLICETVPYSMREVPPEPIADFIQRLEEEEKRITEELAKFDFRKNDVRPLARKPEPAPDPDDDSDESDESEESDEDESESDAAVDDEPDDPPSKPRRKGGKPGAAGGVAHGAGKRKRRGDDRLLPDDGGAAVDADEGDG